MTERIINGLLGTSDTGEIVKRSVYKVKKADNTNNYDRVHFETDSKMICDATNEATADMVARRDGDGGIKFKNTDVSGTLGVSGATKLKSTLTVMGSVALANSLLATGKITASNGLEIVNNNLVVKKGNTSLAGNLSCTGTSSLSGAATFGSTIIANGNITTKGIFALPNTTITNTSTRTEFITSVSNFYFNKPLVFDVNSAVSTNLNADKVDGCNVNDSLTNSVSLWTSKKIDDTKVSKTVRVNAGDGLVGGGALTGSVTITHAIPTQVATSFSTRSTEVVKSIEYDKFGHAVRVVTLDMEGVFATPTQVAEQIANSDAVVAGQYIQHTILNPDGSTKGPARNTVNNVNMKNYSIDYNTNAQCIQFTFV